MALYSLEGVAKFFQRGSTTIRALDGVVSTETFLYLEMWKQLYDWGTRGGN